MGRGKSIVIKDNSTKDNKDSKHRKNQTTNSDATRSKASKCSAQMNQQPKNGELSSPSKSAGHTNHQRTDPVASPPKSTIDALVVTPDNQKSPINVDDGDDSVTLSSILLIDDNKEGGVTGDDIINGSGLTIMTKYGSTSIDNVATDGGALSVNISSTDDNTGLVDTGNNDTGDVLMVGDNLEHNVVEDGAANSKLTDEAIDQIEKRDF